MHNLTVDGEHAGTIIAHKNTDNGAPYHAKYYEVHKDEAAATKWGIPHEEIKSGKHGHPLHQKPVTHNYYDNHSKEYKSVTGHGPRQYGSMDEAIHHVVSAHRNQKEFGAGHSPAVRWAHAEAKLSGFKAHGEIENHHHQAIRSLTAAGHHDLAKTVIDRLDAHKASAAGSGESKAKLKQWLHDAPFHAPKIHHYGSKEAESPHAEAAQRALKTATEAGVHSPHLPW